MPVKKIISGGQTGADSAGLAVGLHLGLQTGGTVPFGRHTEDGVIPLSVMVLYGLRESKAKGFPYRTRANVRDSDGTVIFGNMRSGGSRLTLSAAEKYNKPFLVNPNAHTVRGWAETWGIETLNVAGNRASVTPGIFQQVFDTLLEALS